MVKDGYKQTEIGLIPIDWDVSLVGNIFEFKNGLNKAKEFFGYGTPIVNYMDVFKHYGLKVNDIIGKVDVTREELNAYNVKKGDVFFTRTSETVDEIGITTVIVEDVQDTVFSGFILRARPIRDDLDVNYKKYCFSIQNIRKQIISTASYTTRALTNGKSLSKVQIPIPPKEEQKAIAKTLSDTDELITSLEKLISKKEAIKQGTMQQLLTGKKRLNGFRGDWEEKRLGNLCEMSSGGTPSTKISQYYNGNIPWLSISDITNAGKYITNTERKLTSLGLQNSSATLFNQGTLLLAMYASIGKCCIAKVNISTSQAILGIKTNNQIDTEFLYYYFLLSKDKLANSGQQGTQSNLNKGMVEATKLNLPKVEEQQTIAQILSDMDNEIETLKSKLSKTKAIKDGIMSELLTGKTRLKVKDE